MKRRNYVRPAGRSVRRGSYIRPFGRVINCIVVALTFVAFALAFSVFLIEWMAGCGETYIAADGKRYQHECVFLELYNK